MERYLQLTTDIFFCAAVREDIASCREQLLLVLLAKEQGETQFSG